MINIAVFASGNGTNAQNICEFFAGREDIKVKLILTNNKNAFVLKRAEKLNIPSVVFNRSQFYETPFISDILEQQQIDYIILAGFLWLIPTSIVNNYTGRILNIHPALLPNYGGKGMYGDNVHKAVIEAKEKISGITIHLVNEKYDDGDIVFQAECDVTESDTPDTLAEKIHQLEQKFFPVVISRFINME